MTFLESPRLKVKVKGRGREGMRICMTMYAMDTRQRASHCIALNYRHTGYAVAREIVALGCTGFELNG